MKKIIFISLLILLLLISGCAEEERLLSSAIVVEVLDGDTIKTENETIRLLNINAPEKGEPCSLEATERLKELVLNKEVWFERDKEDYDQYDRKLRYIFLYENEDKESYDGMVNLILLEEGLVKLYVVGTNTKYEYVFRSKFGEIESGCLFQKSQASDCFSIVNFHYDAEGNDCQNNNDEYVVLRNSCQNIEMKDWQIKDEARHIYTFKDFIAEQNQDFVLYTGKGQDTSVELYWNYGCSIWNNDHDTLYLYDDSGNLVLEKNY